MPGIRTLITIQEVHGHLIIWQQNYYGAGTYPITCPSGKIIEGPPPGNYWRVSKTKFMELNADNRIWWGSSGDSTPRLKRFLSEVKQGRVPQTLWTYQEVGHTQEAKKELIAHVPFESSDSVFDTPKPTRLIERMLRIATASNSEDIVLSSSLALVQPERLF